MKLKPNPRVVGLPSPDIPDPQHKVYNALLQHFFFLQQILLLTVALKVLNEPLVCMDLSVGGTAESTRQTIETHWPLFSESPTNISLLFLSVSSNAVALNLINIEKSSTKLKTIDKDIFNIIMYIYLYIYTTP